MTHTYKYPVRAFTAQGVQALWAVGLALLPCAGARADEGGVPFWFSGQYASLAAVPATPGWSLPIQGYYYSGDASRDRAMPRGDSFALDVRSRTSLILAQPTYAPDSKLFGGQLAVGVGFGYGTNTTQAGVSVSPRGTELERSDSVTGFTDLYPVASLAWSSGVHNWMTYVTGDIPVGSYDSKRLANIGLGHGAIDAGGGYTYLNQNDGREFSAVLGLTYNLENTSTNYRHRLAPRLGRLPVPLRELAGGRRWVCLLPAHRRQRLGREARAIQVEGRRDRPGGRLLVHHGRVARVCEPARLLGVLGGKPDQGLCGVRDASGPARTAEIQGAIAVAPICPKRGGRERIGRGVRRCLAHGLRRRTGP